VYGRKVFTAFNGYSWIPIFAPILGSLLGGLLYEILIEIHLNKVIEDEDEKKVNLI